MRLFTRKRAAPTLTAYRDGGDLVVLVSAPDAARADSEVLADSGLDLTRPLLVRHHLLLPDAAAVVRAGELLAQDGYQLTVVEHGTVIHVRAWRTQVLTAMSASQERSRMAGLAQRLGGDVAGWDACGPPSTGPEECSAHGEVSR